MRKLFTVIAILMAGAGFAQPTKDTILQFYFDHNQFTPRAGEWEKLRTLQLAGKTTEVLYIKGFTDTTGSESYNLALSRKRARIVADTLQKSLYLADSIPIDFFGETKAQKDIDNAGNRRVEVGFRVIFPAVVTTIVAPADTAKAVVEVLALEKVYFVPDMPVIEQTSVWYVQEMARLLKNKQGFSFEVQGHVNCPHSFEEDKAYMEKMYQLSVQRAKTVYDILVENGVPAAQLSYKGMSNTQMLFPNPRSDDERRRNMRVEVVVKQ
jgi:outer membrane protein OmpA-like peptidoglycan-associated protein